MKITPELAEIAGIHAGDGYLRYEGSRKELDISGGYEEKDYYDNHVIPLMNKEFGLSIEGMFFPSRRTYGFVVRDRSVLDVFKKLGFPSGSKSLSVRIPQPILSSNNPKIICAFIRGVFDTDGCLTFRNGKGSLSCSKFRKKYHYYPRIILTSVSKCLIGDLASLLGPLKLNHYFHIRKSKQKNWNDTHRIFIVGKGNLLNWMNLIGSRNCCKFSRYQIWNRFGFCPPNTTFDQRINILAGKLNAYSLYEGLVV